MHRVEASKVSSAYDFYKEEEVRKHHRGISQLPNLSTLRNCPEMLLVLSNQVASSISRLKSLSRLHFRKSVRNWFQVSHWQRKRCQVQCGLHPPSLTLLGCPVPVCLCQKSSSFCVVRLPRLAWLPLSSAHGSIYRSKVPQQSLLEGF